MNMKRLAFVGLLAVAFTSTTFMGFQTIYGQEASEIVAQVPKHLHMAQPGGFTPNTTYKWAVTDEKVKAIPQEATLYRFVKKNLTESDLNNLAGKFGLKGQAKKDAKEPVLMMSDGAKDIWLHTETGKWAMTQPDKLFTSATTNIPADVEVSRIATEYLTQKGLLPADFKLQSVVAITEGMSDNNQRVIGKSAYFYRYVDDQPVYGVSRIIVDIGDNGEILGVSKFYKDVEQAGKIKLKTVGHAFNELKEKKALVTTDNPQIKDATIDSVELRYWEDAGSVADQPFMQPVYVFKAKSVSNGKAHLFEGVVPAIEGVSIESDKADHTHIEGTKR